MSKIDFSKCRVKYQAICNEDGKLIRNVSNFGLKKFQQAHVNRNGEYCNFTIEAVEQIKPILTNNHIEKAINALNSKNYEKAASILSSNEWYIRYGEELLFYIVDEWMKINKFDTIYNQSYNFKDDEVDKYIATQRHHPINGKFKIISTGLNSKTSEPVVPLAWIGREFRNAHELHAEMDKLPYRKGKPPVHYCCIYSMNLKEINTWKESENAKKGDLIYEIVLDNSVLKSSIRIADHDKLLKGNIFKITQPNKNIFIILGIGIFIRAQEYNKSKRTVGYLSSLLQKCIRRGNICKDILIKCLNDLNSSPPYNLPDQNFARVSGTRQLLWRSFISIVEDSSGFYVKNKNSKIIDMQDLIILSLISHLDSNLKLTNVILEMIVNTMIRVQSYPKVWRWRDYSEFNGNNKNTTNTVLNAIQLALDNIPMMRNDGIMLRKAFSYVLDDNNKLDYLDEIEMEETIKDRSEIKESKQAAMDMHCKPGILIEIQGMINVHPNKYIPVTLERIAWYIWNNFSRFNFRMIEKVDQNGNIKFNPSKHVMIYKEDELKKIITKHPNRKLKNIHKKIDLNLFNSINRIQEVLIYGRDKYRFHWLENNSSCSTQKSDAIQNNYLGRITWLLIFGQKYKVRFKNRMYEVILAGTAEELVKAKKTVKGKSIYVDGEERKNVEIEFYKNFTETKIKLPSCPDGYKWKFNMNTVKININVDEKNNVNFILNGEIVQPLDLSCYVDQIHDISANFDIPEEFELVLREAFYNEDIGNIFGEDIMYALSDLSNQRRLQKDFRVFEWINLANKVDPNIWRQIVARFFISDIDGNNGISANTFTLHIGPCDRRGKKTNNSISYVYEGIIMRFVIILESIYPSVIIRKTNTSWLIDKTKPEYNHLINSLHKLTENNCTDFNFDKDICIKTKLWDHQDKTVDKIYTGLTFYKKRGFGDASHVGAGKTLTAISLMSKLYNFNRSSKIKNKGGFLVLLPSSKLIKTWKEEIEKHSSGFDIAVQDSDGSYENGSIKDNTIFITTMGRMRDKPIQHPWILVVIDECLTVQNKDALQTEEAWRQSCYSQFGVVMLSATFFRSRFDKMLFMLKMIKSGMPENRNYLDTILSECMICNITETDRVWKTNVDKIELNRNIMIKYNDLYKEYQNSSSEKIYSVLNTFIHNKVNYVGLFVDKVKILEKKGHKIVIFTKSKNEANEIANKYDEIGRYPEKKNHTVLSYAEGTFGLNDLVDYNTILMRPPEPDKLPQIKGRLDRPGQKAKELYIEYMLLKDTIEEAGLIRMEMCNNFYNNHIMPLSDFYDLAVKNGSGESNKKENTKKEKTNKNNKKKNDVRKVVKKNKIQQQPLL